MFLIPLAVYYIVAQIINKKLDVYVTYLLSFGGVTVVMLRLLSLQS
ncbi:MAG: hypothetical protein PUE83_11610 [Lachnobacterium sp.]|nr:hypothetical protein [Lachnobacterium sp.]